MIDCEHLKKMISGAFPCEEVAVESDGRHYEAVIVSSGFAGKSRVSRQQMVNAVLKPYFDSGELHALSMKTLTPAELDALRG
ncbi:MAG: BolA/IbaG family iron-sulfur metabolism protein [Candidatus Accumulibacter sp.]|jgi:acid stress-induced BolA-like protein IbaG/YrbA|nr:BolA/IbaG family iron-sulfur metabolism protein [Accumulibacter sp.]